MAINYTQLRLMRKQGIFGTVPIKTALRRNSAPRWLLLALLVLLASCAKPGYASEPINIEKLANSIYLAEGGAKTRHPYGILTKYKHTTPRQACINTIKSALRRYQASITQDGRHDFIEFLGATYCPIGATNDPNGLNKNWITNVRYYYERT